MIFFSKYLLKLSYLVFLPYHASSLHCSDGQPKKGQGWRHHFKFTSLSRTIVTQTFVTQTLKHVHSTINKKLGSNNSILLPFIHYFYSDYLLSCICINGSFQHCCQMEKSFDKSMNNNFIKCIDCNYNMSTPQTVLYILLYSVIISTIKGLCYEEE